MKTLSVYNCRNLELSSRSLQPAGLWAIKPGYDTPLVFSHEDFDLSSGDLYLIVNGDPDHPLSRNTLGSGTQYDKAPGWVRFWWGEGDPIVKYSGQTLPYQLEAKIGGRRIRIAAGTLEIDT